MIDVMGKINKESRILFLFPKPVKEELRQIESGEAPSERLYGMYELMQDGYKVDYTDALYAGPLVQFYLFMKRCKIKWLPFTIFSKILRSDVVVIKDDFYTLAVLAARLTGKRVIYKDSIFLPPKKLVRKLHAFLNIALADQVVAFSESQIELWKSDFPRFAHKFRYIFYPLDKKFYQGNMIECDEKHTFISVGRDVGRDNATLHSCIGQLNQTLDLITLPYLISEKLKKDPRVRIHQYISYQELFSIYGQSYCSIVPLKKDISYPSGIRAIMESMALSVPVIAARTPVLEEYFEDGRDIIYYDPENVDDLIDKVSGLMSGKYDVDALTKHAAQTMERYKIEPYAQEFLAIISD
jgi:glycosyltransferase involved in cell wall biosynthesis